MMAHSLFRAKKELSHSDPREPWSESLTEVNDSDTLIPSQD